MPPDEIYNLSFTIEGLERLFYALDIAYVYEPMGTEQDEFLRAGLNALRAILNP